MRVTLLHSVPKAELEQVLSHGLKAVSSFDDFGLEMRQGVVYCWLRAEDDKMASGGQRPDYAYVAVMVDEERCLIADMDWISVAMTYEQGAMGRPRNPEAARLAAELYRVTAVPLSQYTRGMFFTPEVLVKGDIAPEDIRAIK
jgi:hypothetical protein